MPPCVILAGFILHQRNSCIVIRVASPLFTGAPAFAVPASAVGSLMPPHRFDRRWLIAPLHHRAEAIDLQQDLLLPLHDLIQ